MTFVHWLILMLTFIVLGPFLVVALVGVAAVMWMPIKENGWLIGGCLDIYVLALVVLVTMVFFHER